jgi:hypothetical protein
MQITFWLILIVTSANRENPQMMHVGNFATVEQCAEGAKTRLIRNALDMKGPRITYLCVQANGPNRTPPDVRFGLGEQEGRSK